MRSGYDAAAQVAKTPTQYIAAQMALYLEQWGELPDIETMYDSYVREWDEEWKDRFGSGVGRCVTEADINKWVFDILKGAMA